MPALLAVIAHDQRLSLVQDLIYQSVGMMIVLGALLLIFLLLTLTGRWFHALEQRPAPLPAGASPSASSSAAAPASPIPTANGPDSPHSTATDPPVTPEEFAAIAAAVHSTLGPDYHITSIQTQMSPELAAWAVEGRRQIFLSHKVR